MAESTSSLETTALTAARRNLVMANRILAHQGIVDSFGHVTVRHPLDPQRYLMARSRAPQLVTVEDIVEFTLDNVSPADEHRPLYAERPIHGSIYQARPDVQAVCHNHAHSLIPFGVTTEPLRPILHMASVIGAEVPVWDIRTEFGDTDMLVTHAEMGHSLARTLGNGRAVLMRGHGSAVVGHSLREVVFTAYYLMVNAELLQQARQLGDPTALSLGEVELTAATLFQPLSQDRAWQDWSAQVGFSGL